VRRAGLGREFGNRVVHIALPQGAEEITGETTLCPSSRARLFSIR
jgi:hypothetical protein